MKIVFDMVNYTWKDIEYSKEPGVQELAFSFFSENEYTDLKHLKFGYILATNGNTVDEGKYPPVAIKYGVADRNPISIKSINLEVDTDYTLTLWVEHREKRVEKQIEMQIGKPHCIFPSWIWVDGRWTPPVPAPLWGGYEWSEEKQQWVEDLTTPAGPNPGYEVE